MDINEGVLTRAQDKDKWQAFAKGNDTSVFLTCKKYFE